MNDTEKRKFWFVRETELAFLYSKLPPLKRDAEDESDCVWIPKSIIEHRTKIGNEHIVTLPAWFCEKNDL